MAQIPQNDLETVFVESQAGYEQAGVRNPPPEIDGRYTGIVTKVKAFSGGPKDDPATWACIQPIYEIKDGDFAGRLVDGDVCALTASNHKSAPPKIAELKRLGAILNNGTPYPQGKDAYQAVLGSAGSQIVFEVSTSDKKNPTTGEHYRNVRPVSKL